MSSEKRGRNRGVRLTKEATELIAEQLLNKWLSNHKDAKLTREARAELMGVSLATSDRVLTEQVVDRATILFVFKNLELSWNDNYLVPKNEEENKAPTSDAQPSSGAQLIESIRELDAQRKHALYRLRWAKLSVALVLIALASFVAYTSTQRFKQWEANEAFTYGTMAYHRGDYEEAKRRLAIVYRSADDKDSAGTLASALRLAGDIEAEEGNLEVAIQKYETCATIWRNLGHPEACAALYEVIGDAQTQLGQYDQAKINLNLALAECRSMKDSVGTAMALRDIGSLCFMGMQSCPVRV
jgi:tetratricopeptide (TPR) repeat protein